jgi:hypothetical protein
MVPPIEIFECFLETFDKSSVVMFREFISRNSLVTKWMIAADYCLDDKSKLNDSIVFSFIPYDMSFDDFKNQIDAIMGKDIKQIKNISQEAIKLINDSRFFHVGILLQKNRTIFSDGDSKSQLSTAREVIFSTLEAMERIGRSFDKIKKYKKALLKSKSNNFNYRLFGNIYIVSILFTAMSLILVREKEVEIIAWFSDRDSISQWCDGVLWDFVNENFYGMAENKNIIVSNTKTSVGMPDLSYKKMWFDHTVRFADYIAGALGALDIINNEVATNTNSPKIVQIVSDVITNSRNLIILSLDINAEEVNWKRVEIFTRKKEE